MTRLTDNTIQARFGAVNDPSIVGCSDVRLRFLGCRAVDRSMVNRNYFITLLLLVPEPSALKEPPRRGAVRLLARSDLRRIYDGAVYPEQLGIVRERFLAQIKRYNPYLEHGNSDTAYWDDDRVLKTLVSVLDGNQKAALEHIKPKGNASNGIEEMVLASLWVDLSLLASSFDIQTATIDLPSYAAPSLPSEQLALVFDDAKLGTTTVRLQNGQGLRADRVAAHLHVTTKIPLRASPSGHRLYPVVATKVAVDDDGRSVVLSFPSLAQIGVDHDNIESMDVVVSRFDYPRYATYVKPQNRLTAKLSSVPYTAEGESRNYNCSVADATCRYLGLYRPAPDAKMDATFVVDAIVPRIVLSQNHPIGSATLRVAFKDMDGAPDTVTLVVTNAELLGAEPIGAQGSVTFDRAKGEIMITGKRGETRVVKLDFGALLKDEVVTVAAKGTRDRIVVPGPAAPLSLTVKAAVS